MSEYLKITVYFVGGVVLAAFGLLWLVAYWRRTRYSGYLSKRSPFIHCKGAEGGFNYACHACKAWNWQPDTESPQTCPECGCDFLPGDENAEYVVWNFGEPTDFEGPRADR